MSFDVALLALGTLLLLIGLLGRVEAEKLTLGTSSRAVRLVSGAFGILFLAIAVSPHIGFEPGTRARKTMKSIAGLRHPARYLIVASVNSLPEAQSRVDTLISAGYTAEARRSQNGRIAVAVVVSKREASSNVKSTLLQQKLCGPDAYPSTGERLVELLYPRR